MAKSFRLTDSAAGELAAAARWYERRQDGLGDRLLATADAAFAEIADRPGSFPQYDGDVRRTRIDPFAWHAYFVEGLTEVVVVAIEHAARNPAGVARRLRRRANP